MGAWRGCDALFIGVSVKLWLGGPGGGGIALLKVVDLWKRYREDGPWVLRGVNMEADGGSIVAIYGANGSGKTTLLKLIAGLLLPGKGKILVSGARAGSRRARFLTGAVMHVSYLYDHLTVRENLEYYALLYGARNYNPESDPRVEKLGLKRYLDYPASQLSYGWRRRADFARALLHGPRLLLVDEPLTGLDERGRGDIIEILWEERSRGTLIVATSPYKSDLERLEPDTLYTLEGGRLVGRPG